MLGKKSARRGEVEAALSHMAAEGQQAICRYQTHAPDTAQHTLAPTPA